jgi:hypothetical protein
MAASQLHGQLTSIETVISGIMVDPVVAFLAALEDNLMPMRDIALANGLYQPQLISTRAGTSIKWTEGEKGATDLNLDVAIAADTTTEFDLTPIEAVVPNMVISFNTENVLVVSVDYTAGTCEVTRGYDGSTALATIAEDTTGKVLGVANGDLQEAGTATASFGNELTNYAHVIEEVINESDIAGALPTDTGENELAYQIMLKFSKMGRQLGNALWRAQAPTASPGNRVMDGFRAQVSTNSTGVSGALKFTHIDAKVEAILNIGVIPDTIFVPPTIKTGMAQWANARLKTVNVAANQGYAGGSLQLFGSAAGPDLEIMVDNSMLPTDVFICRRENLHAGTLPLLRSPYMEQVTGMPTRYGVVVQSLGREGFATEIQCGMAATCQLAYENASGLLTAVTSVDSDGV